MTRNVKLLNYLPPFMQDYREIAETLNAEDPEFVLVWNGAERVLKNEFIATADEYGIAHFEKLLNILPSQDETLEQRRTRVQSRWFAQLPYTYRALLQKLAVLCGEGQFTVSKDFDSYTLHIRTASESAELIDELDALLGSIVPANMIVDSVNTVQRTLSGRFYFAGSVVQRKSVNIYPLKFTMPDLSSMQYFGIGYASHRKVELMNG